MTLDLTSTGWTKNEPKSINWSIQKSIGKTWDKFIADIQSVDYYKCNHTTCTLATTFLKPMMESNIYVWFGYVLETILYHIQGQVSGSMNSDTIN